MAVTIRTKPQIEIGGTYNLVRGDFDWDSSYPTGGEPFDIANHGTIEDLFVQSKAGYIFSWDEANQKVLAYRQKDPAAAGGADIALPEVSNAVDLSAVTGVKFWALISE